MEVQRKLTPLALTWLIASAAAPNAWSSDACSPVSVVTSADVTVSDGSTFATHSYFHTRDFNAIRHVGDADRIVVVEGPVGWAKSGDKVSKGEPFYKTFALGHQYHALLLHFDEIVDAPRPATDIAFGDSLRAGTSGDYPYGGVVHRVDGDGDGHAAGLVFEFPDAAPITATFLDWREAGGRDLPHRIAVDDGQRVFDYRYTEIDVEPKSPTWFFDAVNAPADDAVQILRLHRKLLAAHCLGDADMLAALSAPTIITASRGDLAEHDNGALRDRFARLFERLDYTEYHDLKPAVVEVSAAGDLGWIGVSTRAVGSQRDSGAGFDAQWAWIMTLRKIDGAWRHVANASNTNR